MAATKSSRSPQELSQLGPQVFGRSVAHRLQPNDDGKFVALDVESGEFELDVDDYTAVAKLRARLPRADIWLARVGQGAAYRMRQSR
jgi:hypothetical protein